MRSLQEELLAEREQSIVLLDRTGSVIGAPTMTFKQPTAQVWAEPLLVLSRSEVVLLWHCTQPVHMMQALQAMRAAAASAESKPVLLADPRQAVLNPTSRVGALAVMKHLPCLVRLACGVRLKVYFVWDLQAEHGALQRLNSEAVLQRPGLEKSSGRSFTVANSPALKRLENAPIVNKIQQYVQVRPLKLLLCSSALWRSTSSLSVMCM